MSENGEDGTGNVKVTIPSSDPGNRYLRWNLAITLMLFLTIPMPFWLPYVVGTRIAFYVLVSIQYTLLLTWFAIVIFAWIRMSKLYRSRSRTWESHESYHLVVISIYKEPLEVILATLETLAAQSLASKSCITLSFEDRSGDLENKIETVKEKFEDKFDMLLFTKHKYGLQGEIPGKCSNANHGMRESIRILTESGMDTDTILVTSSDADTKFHPKYLEALTAVYHEPNNGYPCVYQSPLFFNWGLDESSVITRVTALARSAVMLGALIPLNVAPFGIYSFSGKLVKDGNFTHTAYQMDDQTTYVRWMAITRKKIKLVMVPVATISGPTSGRVLEEEIYEWAKQARRWTIGIGEVFHYFLVNAKKIPLRVVLTWPIAFVTCHVTLLCISILFSICLGISLSTILRSIADNMFYVLLPQPIIQYISFILIFILDWIAPSLLVPKPEERISFVRNVFQLIVSPFVLVAYAFVALYAFLDLSVRGRDVCRHNPSMKTCLSIFQKPPNEMKEVV